jgi:predicted nuclease with TOPRIM domain
MLTQELAVVLGPVALGAVLGPILLALMDSAKRRAEAENYETQSDKARFEAMDILVRHMREELERLQAEMNTKRDLVVSLKARVAELEDDTGLPPPP